MFFEETITVKNYPNPLTQFTALPEENKQNCQFQQDWVTTHIAKTTAFLQDFFGDCIVGRSLWPPQSPDFTTPDFFLWGFLTRRVYSHNLRSLENLKYNREQADAGTKQQIL
jgi:hypothetical protein